MSTPFVVGASVVVVAGAVLMMALPQASLRRPLRVLLAVVLGACPAACGTFAESFVGFGLEGRRIAMPQRLRAVATLPCFASHSCRPEDLRDLANHVCFTFEGRVERSIEQSGQACRIPPQLVHLAENSGSLVAESWGEREDLPDHWLATSDAGVFKVQLVLK